MPSIQAPSQNTFQLNHPLIVSGVEKLCVLILWLISSFIEKMKNHVSAAPSLQNRVVPLEKFSAENAIFVDEDFACPEIPPALITCINDIKKHVNTLLDYLDKMSLESPGVADCFIECTALNETLKNLSKLSINRNLLEIRDNLKAIGNYSLEMGELPCFDDLEFLNTINALAACQNQLDQVSKSS